MLDTLYIYLDITIKLIIGISAFLIILRTTGRGQLSLMTPLDLIGNFVLGGIIGGIIYNRDITVVKFIIVLIIWELIIIFVNLLRKHSTFLHNIIIGKVTPVIIDGKFQLEAFKEARLDINSFMTALQMKGVTLQEVSYAQVEANNQISIIRKDENKTTAVLVRDGKVDEEALKIIDHDQTWFNTKLEEKGFKGAIESIFFAEWLEKKDSHGNTKHDLYIIQDQEKQKEIEAKLAKENDEKAQAEKLKN